MFKFALQFIQGIKDSLNFKRILLYLLTSKQLLNYFLGCMVINGVMLTGLTLVLNFLEKWTEMLPLGLGILASLAFNLIYMVTYLLSFMFSSLWFNDIAFFAIDIEKNILKNQSFGPTIKFSITQQIMNEIYRMLLVLFFTLQGSLCSYIPIFGNLISNLHVAFLYSFYCFEYKWGTSSYFSKSLAFFEANAAYFCGFGFVFANLVGPLPFKVSLGVFSTLFPIYLLSAIPHSPPEITASNFTEGFEKVFAKNQPRLNISNFKYSRSEQNGIGIFSWAKYNISLLNTFLTVLMSTIEKNIRG